MTDAEPREARLLSIIRTQTEIAATDLDLEAAMQVVADRAQELTDARGAIIQVPEGENSFRFLVTSGDCGPFTGERLDRDNSLAGHALRQRRPLESPDTRNDIRVDRRVIAAMDIGSLICVPLFHHGETIGVLTVTHSDAHHFTEADRQGLELMSDLIAAQMAHANSFEVEAHESRHDVLTGLANRRSYDDRLTQEFARAQRYKHPVSLCLFDLDGFKAINDRHGHPAGDEILRRVAAVTRTSRRADQAFRIGGDEFALLMPETTGAEAETAVRRLVETIEAIEHPPGGRIGVSFGIAAGPFDSVDLHAAADRRLLDAKAALHGRDGDGDGSLRPVGHAA